MRAKISLDEDGVRAAELRIPSRTWWVGSRVKHPSIVKIQISQKTFIIKLCSELQIMGMKSSLIKPLVKPDVLSFFWMS